jgi:hypothetical protein
MSRNEESRRQFVHWAKWKDAGGRVDQDRLAAEIDDLIAGMPTPLKQTLAKFYLQGAGPNGRAVTDRPQNRLVRQLGQADRILQDQLSLNRARRLRDADAARMALRLQAIVRARSGGSVIAGGLAIAEDGAHRDDSSMNVSLEPLSQETIPSASDSIIVAPVEGRTLALDISGAHSWPRTNPR